MITRPYAAALAVGLAFADSAFADASVLPPVVQTGETYLVVIGPGTTSVTIEELDTASGWALVSSERPEIDGGWINLGQAMMIRPDPR